MTDSSSSPETTRREFTITRAFDAPRELVFKAWTDPEQFARWWGPKGFSTPLSTVSMDVRPGGEWRATMVSDSGGTEVPFFGVYREVVEPERLVFTVVDPNDPDFEQRQAEGKEAEVVTLTFNDLGGKTELVLHQAGYTPKDEVKRAEKGWPSFLDCLDEHLAQA